MKSALVIALAALFLVACDSRPDVRVGTFNIEQYPKSAFQPRAVMEAIEELGTGLVAIQEARDPHRVDHDARRYLGRSWRFSWARLGEPLHVGVLYDEERWELLSTEERTEPIVRERARPAFVARFRHRTEGNVVRLIVLHLKAGGEHAATRAAQWWSLLPIIEEAKVSGEDFVVLGDFNSTGRADRFVHRATALWTGTTWLTKTVECTHYWERTEQCVTTALDHALTSRGGSARVEGACRSVGCDLDEKTCPLWRFTVSDHCPVVVELH